MIIAAIAYKNLILWYWCEELERYKIRQNCHLQRIFVVSKSYLASSLKTTSLTASQLSCFVGTRGMELLIIVNALVFIIKYM